MKPNVWTILTAAAMLTVLTGPTLSPARAAEAPRSPFQSPPRQSVDASRDYDRAIRLVTLKGIVQSEDFSRVMLQLGTSPELFIFAPGDRFSLDFTEIPHGFTVARIKGKSVVFQDAGGNPHELVLP